MLAERDRAHQAERASIAAELAAAKAELAAAKAELADACALLDTVSEIALDALSGRCSDDLGGVTRMLLAACAPDGAPVGAPVGPVGKNKLVIGGRSWSRGAMLCRAKHHAPGPAPPGKALLSKIGDRWAALSGRCRHADGHTAALLGHIAEAEWQISLAAAGADGHEVEMADTLFDNAATCMDVMGERYVSAASLVASAQLRLWVTPLASDAWKQRQMDDQRRLLRHIDAMRAQHNNVVGTMQVMRQHEEQQRRLREQEEQQRLQEEQQRLQEEQQRKEKDEQQHRLREQQQRKEKEEQQRKEDEEAQQRQQRKDKDEQRRKETDHTQGTQRQRLREKHEEQQRQHEEKQRQHEEKQRQHEEKQRLEDEQQEQEETLWRQMVDNHINLYERRMLADGEHKKRRRPRGGQRERAKRAKKAQ